MTNMKVKGVLLMVCLSVVQPNIYSEIAATVNEPVTLPCTCSGQEIKWTIFHPIKGDIAVCQNRMCRIEQHFQKRFSFLGNISTGNFSMSIRSACYNDFGFYRCTCNGESVNEVKLKVYDPRVVKVFQGENTTLPCHGDTRRDTKDVLWKKGGEKVLEYASAMTNETTAGRFTVSSEGFLDGDLSLHISSVHLSDAGLYLCLLHGESRDGDPRAVLLRVEERQPEHQPPNCAELPLGLTLGLVLLAGVIGVIIIVSRRKNKGSRDMTYVSPSVQEETQMTPKPSSTQPFLD